MLTRNLLKYITIILGVILLMAGRPAMAIDNEANTVGGACTTGRDAVDWDTIMECQSSVWARGPLFIGTTTDTCDANHAGMVSYDTSQNLLRFCNGTSWSYL